MSIFKSNKHAPIIKPYRVPCSNIILHNHVHIQRIDFLWLQDPTPCTLEVSYFYVSIKDLYNCTFPPPDWEAVMPSCDE